MTFDLLDSIFHIVQAASMAASVLLTPGHTDSVLSLEVLAAKKLLASGGEVKTT